MARKIQSQDDATEQSGGEGVTFVKNQVNELIRFEDGTSFQFQKSRQTITDPELIEKLRSVATRCNIFEVQ